jgi:Arylsulfotransferase (ASST)
MPVTALLAGATLCASLTGCAAHGVHTHARLPTGRAAVAAAAANAVTVSPLPGTPDASTRTQISLLGPQGTVVQSVHAVGSKSGLHEGRIEPYSTGAGASFLPRHRFLPGETVGVYAKVKVSGREEDVGTSFEVGRAAVEPTVGFPHRPGNPREVLHFASAPSITPSAVKVIAPARRGAAEGDFLLAPYQGTGSPGPMIVDRSGRLVWFHRLPRGSSASNLQAISWQGKPALAWWQGRILKLGFGEGEDVIYDNAYRQIARIRAGNGYFADLHEIRITPEGTAWIDAFDPIHMSLSKFHGVDNGVLTDSVVQEMDVKTGLVMWEWHALGHIPLSSSRNPNPHSSYPWDYAHVNSVDPGSGGDVLLSARNTWTLYDVEIHSGGFRWQLGDGAHSSLRLGPGVRFYWQHDAEWQPGGLISLFDNGSTPPKEKRSSGLLLRPEYGAHRVALAKRLVNPTRTLLAASQGNVQRLAGGDWLLGYGELPDFTELDAAGHVLFDARLGRNVQDLRTYQSPWHATPAEPPTFTVAGGAVHVSWNGATDVASWQLLEGESPSSLTPVATAVSTGFETTLQVPATLRATSYVEVQALNAAGAVIGASPPKRG